MSPERLELALRRQRLQLQAIGQREEFSRRLRPFVPALAAADRVGQGVHWLRCHPETVATVATFSLVVAVVLKPARAWRWAKRSFGAWRLWQRFDAWQRNFGREPGH